MEISNKKYSTAVILSAIFGIVGVHHFYTGNYLHGIFDLGLFIAGILLFMNGNIIAYPGQFK